MITLNRLRESIYSRDYFSESAGSLMVHNESCQISGVLSVVELQSKGSFISLSNKILKDSSRIFQTEDRSAGRISFRRDCDGICFLKVGTRNILLIIEVKSGFNEVKKLAFEQLVASYVKIKHVLQSIDGYNPNDYEEMGIVVSYPPSGDVAMRTTSIIEMKQAIIAPSVLDKLNNENATRLRVDKEVALSLSDYNVDACHVNPALYNSTLFVKHVMVPDQVATETINLDSYL